MLRALLLKNYSVHSYKHHRYFTYASFLLCFFPCVYWCCRISVEPLFVRYRIIFDFIWCGTVAVCMPHIWVIHYIMYYVCFLQMLQVKELTALPTKVIGDAVSKVEAVLPLPPKVRCSLATATAGHCDWVVLVPACDLCKGQA